MTDRGRGRGRVSRNQVTDRRTCHALPAEKRDRCSGIVCSAQFLPPHPNNRIFPGVGNVVHKTQKTQKIFYENRFHVVRIDTGRVVTFQGRSSILRTVGT